MGLANAYNELQSIYITTYFKLIKQNGPLIQIVL